MTAPDVYPDGLLLAVLRPPLTTDGIGVGTLLPADVALRLPYLVAREVPGGGDADDRFAEAVSWQLDGFAVEWQPARALLSRALRLLRAAQQLQTITPHGYLSRLTVTAYPAKLTESDQPDGWTRGVASGTAILRPAPDA